VISGRTRLTPLIAVAWILASSMLAACNAARAADPVPPGGTLPPPESTPPPQTLLLPGESAEGELGEGATDRWIFAAAAGQLATIELWFRPSSASGPDAQVRATLVGPDGETLLQETGTVTLPPYFVEQELDQTGSYLLRLDGPEQRPGRYTLLLTFSDERLLTRPEIYSSTLTSLAGIQGGSETTESWGFVWPSPRRAISGWFFHDPENPDHVGLDIAAAMYDPLVAAAAGTVSFADMARGYGNLVVIDHTDGWQTWYAHLSSFAVVADQEVGQGEIIGAAGSTGYSTGPHLHFELRHQGQPMDPLIYLR